MRRREFITQSGTVLFGALLTGSATAAPRKLRSANEKLNIGVVGVDGRGADDLRGVSTENIVALCDIDDTRLAGAMLKHPKAEKYNDYRKLLDRNDLDAVVVATPDHTHAIITATALKSGRNVYCEKPLTHTVSEAQAIATLARKYGAVTQLGTQIHAEKNYRRVVELLQTGAIGEVHEIHVWVDGHTDIKPLPEPVPVPPNIHYDLWLGPLEPTPYSPEYIPFNWRRWWKFGGGTMADFTCHFMDLSHWAYDLRFPTSIEAEGPPVDANCAPPWAIVHYKYPAGKKYPAINLTWYHGGKRPDYFAQGLLPKWGSGSLFVGSKGMILADYTKHALLPEKTFEDFQPPAPYIPNSIGHHAEWIKACKDGGPTTCNFEYGSALTQSGLLGLASYRSGRKLEFDSTTGKVTNTRDADQYLQHHYAKGWAL